MDGSKADGKVTLTYEYGLFEKPVADWEAANSQAVARCKAWGYSGAESFGAQQEECVNHDGNDCYRYRGTINYQCID
ncbi:MAG: hypothetical protein EOM12_13875 [Verrucomicrobiae bacterium]|nr:hypothetical protein [Verrucomicrobiae bacterium]